METVPHKFHGPQIETWDRTVSLEKWVKSEK